MNICLLTNGNTILKKIEFNINSIPNISQNIHYTSNCEILAVIMINNVITFKTEEDKYIYYNQIAEAIYCNDTKAAACLMQFIDLDSEFLVKPKKLKYSYTIPMLIARMVHVTQYYNKSTANFYISHIPNTPQTKITMGERTVDFFDVVFDIYEYHNSKMNILDYVKQLVNIVDIPESKKEAILNRVYKNNRKLYEFMVEYFIKRKLVQEQMTKEPSEQLNEKQKLAGNQMLKLITNASDEQLDKIITTLSNFDSE